MSVDEQLGTNDTNNSGITVLYSDEEAKHPITWDKNLASIDGKLAAVGRALRTQVPRL